MPGPGCEPACPAWFRRGVLSRRPFQSFACVGRGGGCCKLPSQLCGRPINQASNLRERKRTPAKITGSVRCRSTPESKNEKRTKSTGAKLDERPALQLGMQPALEPFEQGIDLFKPAPQPVVEDVGWDGDASVLLNSTYPSRSLGCRQRVLLTVIPLLAPVASN